MIDDLLACAGQLATDSVSVPTQANLRRAVSTAYYAMFHMLAKNGADMLVGATAAVAGREAWTRVYRGLDHGQARNSCRSSDAAGFSEGVVDFADAFIEVQEARHKADYDPNYLVTVAGAEDLIATAAEGIARLTGTSSVEKQRFAVHLLFKQKST